MLFRKSFWQISEGAYALYIPMRAKISFLAFSKNDSVSWTLSLSTSKLGKYCRSVPFPLTFFQSFSMGL
jgi:hypothetical protein